eukprot:6211724-Lingulodinium_polyedra.AAC.1
MRGRARLGGLLLLTCLKTDAICSGSSTCARQCGWHAPRAAARARMAGLPCQSNAVFKDKQWRGPGHAKTYVLAIILDGGR